MKIYYLLLFFLSFLFVSCGDEIITSKDTGNYSSSSEYNLQLIPGMKFRGGLYYWSTGANITSEFYEESHMGWIDILMIKAFLKDLLLFFHDFLF